MNFHKNIAMMELLRDSNIRYDGVIGAHIYSPLFAIFVKQGLLVKLMMG